MRLLFVVHQFWPEFGSGTERVTLELAKAAQRDGHFVEVLTCSMRNPELWAHTDEHGFRHAVIEGVPVVAVDGRDRGVIEQLGFTRNDAQTRRFETYFNTRAPFDLAHVTHAFRMAEAVELLRDRGLPYVLTLTDFFLPCYRINLIRLSGELCAGPEGGRACTQHCVQPEIDSARLRDRLDRVRSILFSATAVVACSDAVERVFRQEYPDLPMRVINHGIDLLRFPRPQRASARAEIVFGYLGTISEPKGVHVLAEAFLQAAPQQARLELVGPVFDEALAKRLQRASDQNARIVLKPPVAASDVPRTLAGFDILCLPSLVPETFSLAMHEGFAAGLPCLVSDLGYPGALVKRVGCGQALPLNDIPAWKDAIARTASDFDAVQTWAAKVPMPARLEEEGFMYSQIYRAVMAVRFPAAPTS